MDGAPRLEILDEDGKLYAEAEWWEGADAPLILGIVKNPEGFLSDVEYADFTEAQANQLAAFIRENTHTILEATA